MSMKCRRNLVKKPTKEPEHQFENLYGLLCNEVWLRVAAPRHVNTNQGRETAGIDGMTMSELQWGPRWKHRNAPRSTQSQNL